MKLDLLIIGGGPAGMSAAISAKAAGIDDILLVEREERLGGILNQCIHTGFGVELFGQELTGPEFAHRYREKIKENGIKIMTQATVLSLSPKRRAVIQSPRGITEIQAGCVILATGCRERPRGSIDIHGSRPAGIYTAGAAQRLINSGGLLPGRRVLILGSGDIGLIMARRMTLEGAAVEAVCELLPYSGGLTRNIVQCLEDFNIPLLLSHTVTRIIGSARVEGVEICPVDEKLRPITGRERLIECDTLLLSVGLIPENELARCAGIRLDPKTGGPVVNESLETNIPGIFSCGNSLHVHDLADFAAQEAESAGKYAAEFLNRGETAAERFACHAGAGIQCVVPQSAACGRAELYIRVKQPYKEAKLIISTPERILYSAKKSRMTPGEMLRVCVNGIDGEITASVNGISSERIARKI